MSLTHKARRKAFDNIAQGSAITARERTINGSLPPDFTAVGNGENIASGTDYGTEQVIVAATALLAAERVGGP